MKKEAWKKRIKSAAIDAGTYKDFFDPVIETLSGIMELRDNASVEFERSGGEVTVEHTNKGGATNIVKNPALVVLMDCNSQALSYWKELGLTPAGLKKINETALAAGKKESTLEKALKALGC